MRTAAHATAGLATGLVLVLGLGACGEDDARGTGPGRSTATAPSPAQRPAADFAADVTVGADDVTVTYTLATPGDGPLGVLDRVPRGTSGAAVDYDPTAAWVVADGEDGIRLGQQVFARPEDDDVARETQPVTGATLLQPGKSLEGTVTVPRPFVGSHPYGDDPADPEVALPQDPAEVRFCLGVLADTSVLHETPTGELVAANHAAGADLQYLFCSDPVPLT